MDTTTRNANLTDLMGMLRDQHTRKVDIVAPASAIRAVEGNLVVRGTEAVLTPDGVTTADGTYVPTAVCDEGVASKLGIPVGYLKRTRAERPDLYDTNVNGWLHGRRPKVITRHAPDLPQAGVTETIREAVPGDARTFLLRGFRGDDGQPGIARALLSDRFGVMDHIDVLMAALDGIREAGVEVNIDGGDLTDRRMMVRVSAPQVSTLAPALLAGYRSPFTGQMGDDNPTVFAGFVIANSEVGHGALTITPRITVQVCTNGMTMSKDALSRSHVGARMDAGVIRYADDTEAANLTLVTKQTRDAVQTFLSPEYLTDAVNRLEAKATVEVGSVDEVRTLTKGLKYTDAQTDAILSHFVRGGQMTTAGVVNAITAAAQEVTDGDTAYDMEARATSLLGV